MSVQIVRETAALRAVVSRWRKDGRRIAVAPTMGALHEGHLSLARMGAQKADRVIATLFVNPKQFDNPADLEKYPRSEKRDAEKLGATGAHLLYAPDPDEMYPQGFSTTVSVAGVSDGLCGAHRPGHFDGVATVVAKLFLQTRADVGVFGEKDFQQLHVVRRLAKDLDIPIEIASCPVVREADGLAMSSRNLRLTPAERKIAPTLAAVLREAAQRIEQGAPVAEAIENARAALMAAGFGRVDYLELRAEKDLRPLATLPEPARLLAAAELGAVRLIDNVALAPPR